MFNSNSNNDIKNNHKKRRTFSDFAHRFKTLALISGFAFDLYILPPINTGKYLWVGPFYISIILFCILMRQMFRRFINNGTLFIFYKLHNFFYNFFSFFASFFLGSILAYSLIYYSSLSDIFSVWPILVLILIAIFLNEKIKDKIFDVVLFMLAINFYFILNTPIFLNEVSDTSFYLSLMIAFIFNLIILKIIKSIYYESAHNFFYLIFLFFIPIIIYGLYYLKYFPAVPLKLGDSGFYSYVKKIDNGINIKYYTEENGKSIQKYFYNFFNKTHFKKSELKNGEIYFLSSVISPKNASIKSVITHNWEKYNTNTKKWEEKFVFSFGIYGDREEGYRGYSIKSNIEKGEWRVRVLSDQRIIGQRKVIIE